MAKIQIELDPDLLPELFQAIKQRANDLETLCGYAHDEELIARTREKIQRLQALGEQVLEQQIEYQIGR
jgi:hypothetical protein